MSLRAKRHRARRVSSLQYQEIAAICASVKFGLLLLGIFFALVG